MHEPLVTLVGNVAAPPRLRTTPAGVAVADFRVAATPRHLDRATGAWSDGETLWFGVTTWRGLAEHSAASLRKGDRVVVTGRLTTRTYAVEGGERRTALEVDAATVGFDLARGTASYVRAAPGPGDQEPAASDPDGPPGGPVDSESAAA